MSNNPHDLQFTVLCFPLKVSNQITHSHPSNTVGPSRSQKEKERKGATNLESLVLQDSLDGSILTIGSQLCLEYYSERTITHNLALRVLHFSELARNSILYFFPNNLCLEHVG